MSKHNKSGERPDGNKHDPPVSGKLEIERSEYDKLCASAKELGELKDAFLRKAADLDNMRKRLVREKEEFVKFANERLMKDLLPVIDNLERALLAAGHTEGDNAHPIISGVDLVRKQFINYLKDHGLTKIDAVGKPFDPSLHEAVSQRESKDCPDQTVLEEIEGGYLLHGRLLRPAKVIISKKPASQDQTRDGGGQGEAGGEYLEENGYDDEA
ncbi:MAG: nucleotide exchange factor GrpE [Candidatus Omnitrophica bacterium]|nr:nucleotide exchange factor GrpE [Candidatus Omnitrophota bacterium]